MLIGSCFSVILLALHHQLHPAVIWFSGWYMPGVIGICFASAHIYHLIVNWQRIKPFKKEYEMLQHKIEKILEDLKGLTK